MIGTSGASNYELDLCGNRERCAVVWIDRRGALMRRDYIPTEGMRTNAKGIQMHSFLRGEGAVPIQCIVYILMRV